MRILLEKVHEEVYPVDIILIVLVPTFLTFVFHLPQSVQTDFILDYGDPDIINLWSSAYVHRGYSHFSNNLIAYVILVIPNYLLLHIAEERKFFRWTFISFLLLLPAGIAIVNILVLGRGTGAGFSGIGSALFGLLPVSLLVFLHRETSEQIDPSNGVGIFLTAAAIIGAIYGRYLVASGVAIVAFLLIIYNLSNWIG